MRVLEKFSVYDRAKDRETENEKDHEKKNLG